MKKKIKAIVIIIIFLAGLSLLLYPFIANEWNTYRQKRLISHYDTVIADKEATGEIDYEALRQTAAAYNESLVPSVLPDSFAVAAASDEPDPGYMAALNIAGDGIMGVVEIPKIDISLPIYHTCTEEVLEKAAGHLEGSSLPIGGESTHAVITAHRGLPSAALFTDLDRLEEGDHFLIHVLDETLCYEVDQILTVEPHETDALAVEEGEDLVTLITCTPYGVNTHRLMVRGHRVPYEPEVVAEEDTPLTQISLHTSYFLWVIVGLAVTGLFVLLLFMIDRRSRRRAAAKAEELSGARKAQETPPARNDHPAQKDDDSRKEQQ